MQNFVAVKENGAELDFSHSPAPVTHTQNARVYLQLRAKKTIFRHECCVLRAMEAATLNLSGHTCPLFTVHFSSTHCTQTSSWLSDWSSRPQVTV